MGKCDVMGCSADRYVDDDVFSSLCSYHTEQWCAFRPVTVGDYETFKKRESDLLAGQRPLWMEWR